MVWKGSEIYMQGEGRKRYIKRGLFHREGIVVPWKVVEHLSYNIVRGERLDCVRVWLWHECRKLGAPLIETWDSEHRRTLWNMTGFMGELI